MIKDQNLTLTLIHLEYSYNIVVEIVEIVINDYPLIQLILETLILIIID